VIALAISLHADLVLIDERRASKLRETTDYASPALWACSKSPRLVDFTEAARRLRLTTFRSPEALLETMLRKHRRDGGNA
jgi:hypothetical protein